MDVCSEARAKGERARPLFPLGQVCVHTRTARRGEGRGKGITPRTTQHTGHGPRSGLLLGLCGGVDSVAQPLRCLVCGQGQRVTLSLSKKIFSTGRASPQDTTAPQQAFSHTGARGKGAGWGAQHPRESSGSRASGMGGRGGEGKTLEKEECQQKPSVSEEGRVAGKGGSIHNPRAGLTHFAALSSPRPFRLGGTTLPRTTCAGRRPWPPRFCGELQDGGG